MKKEVRIALLNGNVSFIDERSCDDYSSKSSCLIMLQRWIIHLRTRVGSSCTYLGRLASVRRCVLLLIFLCLVFLLYSAHHLSSIRFNKWVKFEPISVLHLWHHDLPTICLCSFLHGPRLDSSIHCSSTRENGIRLGNVAGSRSHSSPGRLRIDAKVLLFAETQYSHLGRDIAELLVHNRLKWVCFFFEREILLVHFNVFKFQVQNGSGG